VAKGADLAQIRLVLLHLALPSPASRRRAALVVPKRPLKLERMQHAKIETIRNIVVVVVVFFGNNIAAT
jgi:hypothetical protein